MASFHWSYRGNLPPFGPDGNELYRFEMMSIAQQFFMEQKMKILILDGSHANDPQAANLLNALHKQLPEAETITLREQKIGNCAGDFFCWVRSPGLCNTR